MIGKRVLLLSNSFKTAGSGSTTNATSHNKGWKPKDKDWSVCTHCGKKNHIMDTCYKLHGYPPGFGRGKFGVQNKKFDHSYVHINQTIVNQTVVNPQAHVDKSSHNKNVLEALTIE